MAISSSQSPSSAGAVQFFNLVVFAHLLFNVSVFLVACTGFAVGFTGAFSVAAIAIVQATSTIPGFLYVYCPSTFVLSTFIASQIVVGASEIAFAVAVFIANRIIAGILLLLLVVLQGFLIFVAFQRPQTRLSPKFAGFVNRLFEDANAKEGVNHESGVTTTCSTTRKSRKADSLENCSLRVSSPSMRSLPRSDMATSTLQLSKESINEPDNAGIVPPPKTATAEADVKNAITSASGAPPSSGQKETKVVPEQEPTSTDRISEETKSLQSIADQARVPVIVDKDLSNSIEQYLFEDCVQFAEKQNHAVPPVSSLPPDICTAPKAENSKEKGEYELIHQAKNSASAREKLCGKPSTTKSAKTTVDKAKVVERDQKPMTVMKPKYPASDGVPISDSSEESQRKRPRRWQFVPKKEVSLKK